jgi:O-antigen/teichoic acid export membrane protein
LDLNLGKNSLYSIAILAINIGVRILTAPLVVKNFNPEISGLYYLILNVTSYFLFFDFGISRAFIYFKIKNSTNFKLINNFFFTSIFFYLFIVLFIGIIFYFMKEIFISETYIRHKNLTISLVSISIVQLFFQFLVQLFSSIWESFGKMYFSKYLDLVSLILFIFSLYLGIFVYHDLVYMFCFILLTNIVVSFLHLYFLYKMKLFQINSYQFRFTYLKILFRGGFYIMASNFVTTLYNLIDITLIPIFLSIELVSYYVLSLNFTKLIHSLSGAILAPMPVILANSNKEDSIGLLSDKTNKFLSINLAVVLIFTLFVIFFHKELVTLWINIDFAKNVENVVILLTISWMFHSLSITAFQFFESNNLSKVNFSSSLVLSLITLFLFFLFKDFGLIGFAAARIIGTFFFLIILYSKLSNLLNKNYLNYLLMRVFLFFTFVFISLVYFYFYPNFYNLHIKAFLFLVSSTWITKYSIINNYLKLKNSLT